VIGLSASLEFFFSTAPTDMRKSFDGLCGEVRRYVGREPTDGSVFVFVNRRRDRMKLLWWDRHGFWLFYKRLEQGRFELPAVEEGQSRLLIGYEQLLCIIEGIELSSVRRRKRYRYLRAAS
jgi:transposase